jgi:hypothetical protein
MRLGVIATPITGTHEDIFFENRARRESFRHNRRYFNHLPEGITTVTQK